MDYPQLLIGLVLAALVAYSAFRLKVLDKSGAWAAFALGTIVFGLGGIAWALVLLTFFVSSSALSKLFVRKKDTIEEKYAKGSKRDGWQVLANGGLAGVAVLLHVIFPNSVIPWVAFAAAFAAANADTWATELGILNKTSPRMIHTGKIVPKGTSGGVSLVGTLAAAAGSLVIALMAYLVWFISGLSDQNRLFSVIVVMIAGVIGSLVDSLTGATVQGIYWCETCGKETEKHPYHSCGSATALRRGKKWITNDWVNLFCTSSAMIIATLITFQLK